MFCTNCGSKLPDGARFCSNCGTPVGPAANTNTSSSRPSEPVKIQRAASEARPVQPAPVITNGVMMAPDDGSLHITNESELREYLNEQLGRSKWPREFEKQVYPCFPFILQNLQPGEYIEWVCGARGGYMEPYRAVAVTNMRVISGHPRNSFPRIKEQFITTYFQGIRAIHFEEKDIRKQGEDEYKVITILSSRSGETIEFAPVFVDPHNAYYSCLDTLQKYVPGIKTVEK